MIDSMAPPEPSPQSDGFGFFHLDRTIHLNSGGSVRLEIKASMAVTRQSDLDFAYRLITALRDYERENGIDIADDLSAEDVEGD